MHNIEEETTVQLLGKMIFN